MLDIRNWTHTPANNHTGDANRSLLDAASKPLVQNSGLSATEWVLCVALIVIALCTTLYNGAIIWIFCREAKMRTSFFFYILNLSVADFLMAAFSATGSVAVMINPVSMRDPYCGVYFVMEKLSISESGYAVLLIALDRLGSLLFPIFYKNNRSTKQTVAACSTAWVFGAFLVAPYVALDRLRYNDNKNGCTFGYGAQPTYSSVVEFLGFDIPPVLTLFLYACMFLKLLPRIRKRRLNIATKTVTETKESIQLTTQENLAEPSRGSHGRSAVLPNQKSTGQHSHEQSGSGGRSAPSQKVAMDSREEIKLHRLFGLLGLNVLVCWVPGIVYFLMVDFNENYWDFNFYAVVVVLQFCSGLLNPFIYHSTLPEVRTALKRLFCKP